MSVVKSYSKLKFVSSNADFHSPLPLTPEKGVGGYEVQYLQGTEKLASYNNGYLTPYPMRPLLF